MKLHPFGNWMGRPAKRKISNNHRQLRHKATALLQKVDPEVRRHRATRWLCPWTSHVFYGNARVDIPVFCLRILALLVYAAYLQKAKQTSVGEFQSWRHLLHQTLCNHVWSVSTGTKYYKVLPKMHARRMPNPFIQPAGYASLRQETQVSAQIFEAAGARFLNSPWRQHPTSTIYDVRGGRQVYQWIEAWKTLLKGPRFTLFWFSVTAAAGCFDKGIQRGCYAPRCSKIVLGFGRPAASRLNKETDILKPPEQIQTSYSSR